MNVKSIQFFLYENILFNSVENNEKKQNMNSLEFSITHTCNKKQNTSKQSTFK